MHVRQRRVTILKGGFLDFKELIRAQRDPDEGLQATSAKLALLLSYPYNALASGGATPLPSSWWQLFHLQERGTSDWFVDVLERFCTQEGGVAHQ